MTKHSILYDCCHTSLDCVSFFPCVCSLEWNAGKVKSRTQFSVRQSAHSYLGNTSFQLTPAGVAKTPLGEHTQPVGILLRSLVTLRCLPSLRRCPHKTFNHCLRAQPREYTFPYPVPEITFSFKLVHREEVVIQELGDRSIEISHP